MKIIGAELTGLCVSLATALSLASADASAPTPAAGIPITCDKGEKTASVSQPNTAVTVTCGGEDTVDPKIAENGLQNIYSGANCSQQKLLSSVCPGATMANGKKSRSDGTAVEVLFTQLPASQQVVCLKCKEKGKEEQEEHKCLVMITVAPASPRGPQVCAVRGSSVTLRINEAGGSAQFACGNNLALEPGDVAKAYADDCTNQETLKDMSRSPVVTGTYVTFKVDKLKKKRLCYLCKPRADVAEKKTAANDESCKVYVEVGGSPRSSSGFHFSVALSCLAAMLRFS